MARGTLYVVNAFTETLANGTHDMDTDVFKMALVSVMPTAATTVLANEVSGTNYTPGGELLTTTWTRTSSVTSWKTSTTAQWTADGAAPNNIVAGVIHNTSAGNAVVCYVDFTEDGSTPISLQTGDISWTAGAGTVILTVST